MAGTTKLMTPGGGGVALTPASSIASDVTVNVPSQNCTLGIQGPAFSVVRDTSSQSVSAATYTKVQFNSVNFDTSSGWSAANYRWTPNVAGYYQFNLNITCSGATNIQEAICQIYKNSTIDVGWAVSAAASNLRTTPSVSAVVYMNGTTDYVEAYGFIQSGTSLVFVGTPSRTSFSGCLVRAA